MKSIKEKAEDYVSVFHPSIQRMCKESFGDGANYVLDAIQSCIDRHEDGCLALEAIILTIDELKNK